MLQADEIIQQKEWYQLTAEEKNIVQELAGTEQEYNLLKKMLIVTAESISEVPPVNERVQENIKAGIPVLKRSSFSKAWYAAAAAIIAMAIAAFFIFKRETAPKEFVKKEDHKNTPVNTIIDSSSLQQDKTPLLVKKEQAPAPVQKNTPAKKPVFNSLQDSTAKAPLYVAVDISIGNDKELLDLVTEAE